MAVSIVLGLSQVCVAAAEDPDSSPVLFHSIDGRFYPDDFGRELTVTYLGGQRSQDDVAVVRQYLLGREVGAMEAAKEGLGDLPDPGSVHSPADLKDYQAKISALLGLLQANFLKTHPIGEATVEERYRLIADSLRGTRQYHVRHILVQSDSQAQSLIDRIDHGENFAQLASAFTIDKVSAAAGGDLGWVNPRLVTASFAQAMTSLAPGEMTQHPIRTEFGYHVIRLDDVRDTPVPSIEEVRARVRAIVEGEEFNSYLRSLAVSATIR